MACLVRTGHVCLNWTWTRIGLGLHLDLDVLDDLLRILGGLHVLAGPLYNS